MCGMTPEITDEIIKKIKHREILSKFRQQLVKNGIQQWTARH